MDCSNELDNGANIFSAKSKIVLANIKTEKVYSLDDLGVSFNGSPIKKFKFSPKKEISSEDLSFKVEDFSQKIDTSNITKIKDNDSENNSKKSVVETIIENDNKLKYGCFIKLQDSDKMAESFNRISALTYSCISSLMTQTFSSPSFISSISPSISSTLISPSSSATLISPSSSDAFISPSISESFISPSTSESLISPSSSGTFISPSSENFVSPSSSGSYIMPSTLELMIMSPNDQSIFTSTSEYSLALSDQITSNSSLKQVVLSTSSQLPPTSINSLVTVSFSDSDSDSAIDFPIKTQILKRKITFSDKTVIKKSKTQADEEFSLGDIQPLLSGATQQSTHMKSSEEATERGVITDIHESDANKNNGNGGMNDMYDDISETKTNENKISDDINGNEDERIDRKGVDGEKNKNLDAQNEASMENNNGCGRDVSNDGETSKNDEDMNKIINSSKIINQKKRKDEYCSVEKKKYIKCDVRLPIICLRRLSESTIKKHMHSSDKEKKYKERKVAGKKCVDKNNNGEKITKKIKKKNKEKKVKLKEIDGLEDIDLEKLKNEKEILEKSRKTLEKLKESFLRNSSKQCTTNSEKNTAQEVNKDENNNSVNNNNIDSVSNVVDDNNKKENDHSFNNDENSNNTSSPNDKEKKKANNDATGNKNISIKKKKNNEEIENKNNNNKTHKKGSQKNNTKNENIDNKKDKLNGMKTSKKEASSDESKNNNNNEKEFQANEKLKKKKRLFDESSYIKKTNEKFSSDMNRKKDVNKKLNNNNNNEDNNNNNKKEMTNKMDDNNSKTIKDTNESKYKNIMKDMTGSESKNKTNAKEISNKEFKSRNNINNNIIDNFPCPLPSKTLMRIPKLGRAVNVERKSVLDAEDKRTSSYKRSSYSTNFKNNAFKNQDQPGGYPANNDFNPNKLKSDHKSKESLDHYKRSNINNKNSAAYKRPFSEVAAFKSHAFNNFNHKSDHIVSANNDIKTKNINKSALPTDAVDNSSNNNNSIKKFNNSNRCPANMYKRSNSMNTKLDNNKNNDNNNTESDNKKNDEGKSIETYRDKDERNDIINKNIKDNNQNNNNENNNNTHHNYKNNKHNKNNASLVKPYRFKSSCQSPRKKDGILPLPDFTSRLGGPGLLPPPSMSLLHSSAFYGNKELSKIASVRDEKRQNDDRKQASSFHDVDYREIFGSFSNTALTLRKNTQPSNPSQNGIEQKRFHKNSLLGHTPFDSLAAFNPKNHSSYNHNSAESFHANNNLRFCGQTGTPRKHDPKNIQPPNIYKSPVMRGQGPQGALSLSTHLSNLIDNQPNFNSQAHSRNVLTCTQVNGGNNVGVLNEQELIKELKLLKRVVTIQKEITQYQSTIITPNRTQKDTTDTNGEIYSKRTLDFIKNFQIPNINSPITHTQTNPYPTYNLQP